MMNHATRWTTTNMKPETKKMLHELSVALGNEYVAMPLFAVLDLVIKAKHNEVVAKN